VPRASLTGNALLGLIALRPASSTYELAGQVTRALRFLLPRVASRVYDEAKRLAERGLVTARDEGSGQRPRTIYTLTDEGRTELLRWLDEPVAATRLESEALLRLLVGRLATTDQLREAVRRVAADAAEIFAEGRTVATEYLAGRAPFQDDVAYRSLVFDFLHRHAAMLEAWAEDAAAVLDTWDGADEKQRADAALDRIRRALDAFPAD
jgi:PadR family transcriptional regulator, regulatory protein AphA